MNNFFILNHNAQRVNYDVSFVRLNNNNLSTITFDKVENQIVIYPNPAQDFVQIKTGSEITSISIYDINGKVLTSFDAQNVTKDVHGRYKVSIQSLPNGLYFLKAQTIDQVITQKFMVKR